MKVRIEAEKIQYNAESWANFPTCLLLSLAVDVPVDEASRSNAAAPGTLDEALNNGR